MATTPHGNPPGLASAPSDRHADHAGEPRGADRPERGDAGGLVGRRTGADPRRFGAGGSPAGGTDPDVTAERQSIAPTRRTTILELGHARPGLARERPPPRPPRKRRRCPSLAPQRPRRPGIPRRRACSRRAERLLNECVAGRARDRRRWRQLVERLAAAEPSNRRRRRADRARADASEPCEVSQASASEPEHAPPCAGPNEQPRARAARSEGHPRNAATKSKKPARVTLRALWNKSRRRPTLPHGYPCSTIGSEELNFRVRDGIGCGLFEIITGNLWVTARREPRCGGRQRTVPNFSGILICFAAES